MEQNIPILLLHQSCCLQNCLRKFLRWQKGREILILTGDIEMSERGRIMQKFEDSSGPSRIFVASMTACADGVSLKAASRVIQSGTLPRKSKTLGVLMGPVSKRWFMCISSWRQAHSKKTTSVDVINSL